MDGRGPDGEADLVILPPPPPVDEAEIARRWAEHRLLLAAGEAQAARRRRAGGRARALRRLRRAIEGLRAAEAVLMNMGRRGPTGALSETQFRERVLVPCVKALASLVGDDGLEGALDDMERAFKFEAAALREAALARAGEPGVGVLYRTNPFRPPVDHLVEGPPHGRFCPEAGSFTVRDLLAEIAEAERLKGG